MATLKVNNIDMYYDVEGQGEPLLLIHGLGSSTQDWDLQMSHFAKRYKVIRPDLRGHGRSSKAIGPYSMKLLASDVAGLLRQLGVGPVHVCGISLGGMVSFQLAADSPELVKTMTIVNSGPAVLVSTFKERLMIWRRYLFLKLLSMEKLAGAVMNKLLPRPEHEQLRKEVVARMGKNDKPAYRATLDAIVGWSVLDHVGKMNFPALIVTGDLDYSPVEAKEFYVKMMPNAQLVVVNDARHALPMEWPEKFNDILQKFLDKHPMSKPKIQQAESVR